MKFDKLLSYVQASKQAAAVAGHQGHSDTDDNYHMGRAAAYQDIERLLIAKGEQPVTTFNDSHPDFYEWTDQIDWDLRYDDSASAYAVIDKMVDLGFTITPPHMPRYALTYNGHAVFRSDSREHTEKILGQMSSTIGYEITDREEKR